VRGTPHVNHSVRKPNRSILGHHPAAASDFHPFARRVRQQAKRISATDKGKILDKALWITWYDISEAHREAYLSWLNGSYLPNLLKRPGILWAGHYLNDSSIAPPPTVKHVADGVLPAGNDYILFVCADSTERFANPTRAKYHAGLPQDDQRMLAMRTGERVNIFMEEERTAGPAAAERESGMMLPPCIQIGNYNADSHDDEDELQAWYMQFRMPSMTTLPGCIAIRKLVSVSGWAKHGVIYEFLSAEVRAQHFRAHESADPAMKAWTDAVVRKLVHAPGSANVATRIWPPVKK
jgi:hypothetical protein